MEKTDRLRVSGMEMMRYRVIQEVIGKRLTQMEAAVRLDLSARQVRRLVRSIQRSGLDGIVHGLVGKPAVGSKAISELLMWPPLTMITPPMAVSTNGED